MDFPLSDLLTLNKVVGGVYTSTVGLDANGNGQFDNGEFALAVQMQGASYLSSGDLIL